MSFVIKHVPVSVEHLVYSVAVSVPHSTGHTCMCEGKVRLPSVTCCHEHRFAFIIIGFHGGQKQIVCKAPKVKLALRLIKHRAMTTKVFSWPHLLGKWLGQRAGLDAMRKRKIFVPAGNRTPVF